MTIPRCTTEHFKVDRKSIIDITSVEFRLWFVTYCTESICSKDAHKSFAVALGITAEEAKTLAHRIAYNADKGLKNLNWSN